MLLLYQNIKSKSKPSKTLFIFWQKKAPLPKTVKEEILLRYKHIDNEKQEPIEFRWEDAMGIEKRFMQNWLLKP